MKKKILILSLDYYPGDVGGAEVAIKAITDRIAPEEIEFHLITMRYDTSMAKVKQLGNVLVHRIGFGRYQPTIAERRAFPLHLNKHLFQITAFLKATALNRRHRYDGVWTMMAHSCGIPAALFKYFHPRVTYILTLQEGEPPAYIERLMRPVWPLFVRAFTSADVVQAISTFLGEWAVTMGYPKKPLIIPNGVDVARFAESPSPAKVTALHEVLGKKPNDIFLVTTSRMVHKNGLDMVITALPKLPEQVSFLIYGDGGQKADLQRLAESLGVSHRVRYMGIITHEEMPLHLRAGDIFIRPSRSEGMGNSFIEAMAAGVPVIATQVGGIADFLFDAQRNPSVPTTGFAVPPEDADAIVRQVQYILSHPREVAEVVATASKMVRQSYDWQHIATMMRDKVFLAHT